MADQNEKTSRVRPGMMIGAGVMGVVTASIGVVVPPAVADDYPSWNDVQQAKANVQNQQAMIDNITRLISGLQNSVDAAGIASEKAAEAYFQAKDALAKATAKEADLQAQATAAAEKAKTSQMRAGLLASHLAKSGGGGDISSELMLKGGGSGSDADKLLYQLGTMSKLTAQSKTLYDAATRDKNTADALTAQAKTAKTEREDLAVKADQALKAAQQAQAAAQQALATQQSKSAELIAQLATLKNTSAAVEAQYIKGEQIRAAQAAAAAAAAAAAKAAEQERIRQQQAAAQQQAAQQAAAQQGHNSGGGAPASSGGGGGGAPAAPNGNVVQTAISYARAQLGKPYIFGGEGPTGYDCSGLTMKAYAYAGVYIGSHSVNDQYFTARSRGQLVSFGAKQAGDLIFWGDSPGNFYHVGLYIGGGMMIAAPTEGDVVKVQSVWGSPWYQVARPSA